MLIRLVSDPQVSALTLKLIRLRFFLGKSRETPGAYSSDIGVFSFYATVCDKMLKYQWRLFYSCRAFTVK